MGVLSVQMGSTGLAGVNPRVVYIDTNDTLATVTTAGYLNKLVQQGYAFSESDMCCVTTRTAPNATVIQVAWLEVSYVAPNWSLVPTGSPGQVVLPTTANYLVHATNATGTLSTAAANVTNAGNISAGLSGTAGYLESFPATAARGSLRFVAANSAGNTVTQVTNASQAAARIYTIPDGGQAASNFLLTDNAGTQTIATGSLALTLGNLTVTAGNLLVTAGTIVGGTTITAGINNASAGSFVAIPAGNNQGSFRFVPVANAGNFASTISNTAIGQATVYSLPDAANALARVLVGATATPFTASHVLIASGTGGLVADAGYQLKTVAGAAVAGGAAAQVVVDAFVTAASNIVASWNTQTNAASILTVTPGVGQFTVTSSADPGVSTLNYIVTKV